MATEDSRQEFRTFEEFWPFYVKEHQKKATRILHFIGTTGAMACVAGGLLTKRRCQMDDEVERVLREERDQVDAERAATQDGSAQAGSPSEVVN